MIYRKSFPVLGQNAAQAKVVDRQFLVVLLISPAFLTKASTSFAWPCRSAFVILCSSSADSPDFRVPTISFALLRTIDKITIHFKCSIAATFYRATVGRSRPGCLAAPSVPSACRIHREHPRVDGPGSTALDNLQCSV